jgi:hypothetical protein
MHFKNNVALKEIGWKVRPVENSLQEAVAWFHSIGLI